MADDDVSSLLMGYEAMKNRYSDPSMREVVLSKIKDEMGQINDKTEPYVLWKKGNRTGESDLSKYGTTTRPKTKVKDQVKLINKESFPKRHSRQNSVSITHKTVDHPEYLSRLPGTNVPSLGNTDLAIITGPGPRGEIIGYSQVDEDLGGVYQEANADAIGLTAQTDEESGEQIFSGLDPPRDFTGPLDLASPSEDQSRAMISDWINDSESQAHDKEDDEEQEIVQKPMKKIWKPQTVGQMESRRPGTIRGHSRTPSISGSSIVAPRRPGVRVRNRLEEMSDAGESDPNSNWDLESDPGSSISARASESGTRDQGEITLTSLMVMMQGIEKRMTRLEKHFKKSIDPLKGISGKLDRQQKAVQSMRTDLDGAMKTVSDLVFMTSSGGKGAGPVGYTETDSQPPYIDDGHIRPISPTSDVERIRRQIYQESRRRQRQDPRTRTLKEIYDTNRSCDVSKATRGMKDGYTKMGRKILDLIETLGEFLGPELIETYNGKLMRASTPDDFAALERQIRASAEDADI